MSIKKPITVTEIESGGDLAEWMVGGLGDQGANILSIILLKRPIAMTSFFIPTPVIVSVSRGFPTFYACLSSSMLREP